jgi:hypothetical protein
MLDELVAEQEALDPTSALKGKKQEKSSKDRSTGGHTEDAERQLHDGTMLLPAGRYPWSGSPGTTPYDVSRVSPF